jgi:hypothetical protein
VESVTETVSVPTQILVPIFVVLLFAGAILTEGREHLDESGRPTFRT